MSGRWYRFTAPIRCKLGIHCWRGIRDYGDGVHCAPMPGYRKPQGRGHRVCTWCGATCRAVRPDDRSSSFVWSAKREGAA